MYKPTKNPGGGGPPQGGDGDSPKPSAVRSGPGSAARATPVPVLVAPEAPTLPGELLVDKAQPVPTGLLHLWAQLTLRERWSSLVVVPAQPGTSGLEAGRAIVSVGSPYCEKPIRLIDAEGLPPGAASRLVREVRSHVEQGGMVVICIDSVLTSPVGLEVALGAERALLCVPLGSTRFSAASQTLKKIGKARFLGSVTLRPGA